jgi:hypothetical protein
MDRTERRKTSPGLVPVWLYLAGKAEALARSYAVSSLRAVQMLMAFVTKVAENTVEPLFSTPVTMWKLAPSLCAGPSVPLRERPPTGEPDAGDPHVRFGGRGRLTPLPTPIGRL